MVVNIPSENCIDLKLTVEDYVTIFCALSSYKHTLEGRILDVEVNNASVDKLEEFKKKLADVEKVMKLLD